MQLNERERKVDLNKMSTTDVDLLSAQIGQAIGKICDEAAEKVNTILKIYGASAKIAIQFDKLPEVMNKELTQKTKKPRKTKKNNLK